ncbi:cytochrome b/b6 domain-containing protein [Pseudomonas aeruginosa]
MNRALHAWPVRLCHWLNAYAMACLIGSGWGIYNASPLLDFRFPAWATLGGWLGGSIAWHLAAMWLLLGNGVCYLAYGLSSGHFRRDFLPLSAAGVWRDLRLALGLRLVHEPGRYNAVQRLLYWLVLALGALLVLSGLAIWKPVQLHGLTALFGGFQGARWVHFLAMAGVVGFVVVHLLLVLLVPRTLVPMIIGREWRRGRRSEG